MKKILFLAFFALFFVSCSQQESEITKQKPFELGEKITLTSVNGASVSIERTNKGFKLENSDKIVMFDIFGTFCQPCQKEAAHLMDYQLKNSDNFMLIGLITFEKISNQDVIDKFIKPFNAYYFIANDEQNERLIAQILADIEYKNALSLPFKVVLNKGEYENLSDNLGERGGKKSPFYLGAVDSQMIADDIIAIRNK